MANKSIFSILFVAFLTLGSMEMALAQANHTALRQKVSLDFQDIAVRQVLQVLAEYTGVNIAVADSVQGNITLKLKNIPADQALNIILQTKNLVQRQSGNVIWITTQAEAKQQQTATTQSTEHAKSQRQTSSILHTEYIRLNYAKGNDVVNLFKTHRPAKTIEGTANVATTHANSLLSEAGSIAFDERTNTLIIYDEPHRVAEIRKLIQVLDIPVKQVMVEARIVRASTNFSKELGVRWGVLGSRDHGKWTVAGNQQQLWHLRNQQSNELMNNINIDLGTTNQGLSSLAIGLLGIENFILDLELSALQSDGYGEIVSTPKVLTLDNQKASIVTGQEIPYQSIGSVSGVAVSTTSFKEALLKLDVTPSIMPNGQVRMQLQVTNNSPNYAFNGQVVLNKNELDTQVIVRDGETIVLGGVYEHTQQNNQSKVPILGDLPVAGRLFRKSSNTHDKRELLIFITPRIINDTSLRNE